MVRSQDHPGDLEGCLGYRFQRPDLLQEALTHTSAGSRRDNQRLEFLGDALLNFTVAFLLHRERPDWQEGPMSKLRGVLVRTESLHAWALDLGLDRALRAVHPRKAPPMGPKPLADALEALLAAIYLDAEAAGLDGMLRVSALVEARFLASIREARPESWTRSDPKTHLQETVAWAPGGAMCRLSLKTKLRLPISSDWQRPAARRRSIPPRMAGRNRIRWSR